MPYAKQSIAVLRYGAVGGHATGFFVDTRNHGHVCVTAAHVFHRDRHPGPDRAHILVNGKPARLIFNAFEEYGIDVALVSIPTELDVAALTFHSPGVSRNDQSAFYSHAWSAPKAQPNRLMFTKIWGVRFGPEETIDNDADPEKVTAVKQWLLRSDVAKRPTQFEPAIFQPGWSGAPVFNVRSLVVDHRVIGVLSSHAGDREATAVSVESLDFLEPREAQTDEILPPPLVVRRQATVDATAELAALRFAEITDQEICPKISEPASPYDEQRV